MLQTSVQEHVSDMIRRAERLPQELSLWGFNEKEGEDFQTYLDSIKVKFEEDRPQIGLILTEIENNLSADLRPAQERRYVEGIDGMLSYWEDAYSTVESNNWEDSIRVVLNRRVLTYQPMPRTSLIDSTSRPFLDRLMELVRQICYDLTLMGKSIAILVQNNASCYKEEPDHFTYINLFNSPNAINDITPASNTPIIAETPKGSFTDHPTEDLETESINYRSELSAVQKLLFIRLLQNCELFPKRTKGTDAAPELRAIASITGLNYENDIKGGNGANAKVDQLLNGRTTAAQRKYKIADLDAVEYVAKQLNAEAVIIEVSRLRASINESLLD